MSSTYKRAGLLGVGLMGSSVALGLRQAGVVETWVGMDSDPHAIENALKIGSIQEVTSDLEEMVRQVDWVVLAVPVCAVVALAEQIVPLIDNPHYFMIDVGSTKRTIVTAIDALFAKYGKKNRFVGTHPIAGKEKTGPLVADSELFHGKTVYVTPSDATDPELVLTVEELWKRLGAQTRHCDPKIHDEILAVSSHLPHMVAFALMDAVQREYENRQINHSLGGGLRDMTRVVSSSPEMWADICSENQTNILKQVDLFSESLEMVRALVKTGDATALCQFFREKKQFRDALE